MRVAQVKQPTMSCLHSCLTRNSVGLMAMTPLCHCAGHAGSTGEAAHHEAYAAELYGLQKVFPAPRSCCRAKGEDFWAIKGTWLGIDEGQLFCLLGPNGAGKTTTINCLTGRTGVLNIGWALIFFLFSFSPVLW